MIKIIVAYDANYLIGNDGKIPWNIPDETAHFKRTTIGHAVVMGRKTWESIGRPLPNRTNFILSRNNVGESIPNQLHFIPSIEFLIGLYRMNWPQSKDLFVIGGAEIYKQFLDLNLVDEIIATTIHDYYDGNAYFPELDKEKWYLSEILAVHDDFHVSKYIKRTGYLPQTNVI